MAAGLPSTHSSLVECEHPVAEGDPERTDTSDGPETAMVLGTPFPDVLMCAIAEWRIRAELAVAELVVARFADVESNRSIPGHDPLALTVAHGVDLTMTAGAPVI